MDNATRYLPFLGRVLIGGIFALSGVSKLAAYGATTAEIASVHLPLPPLAFAVAVIVELGFGLLLVIGFQTRLVALVLAIWCVVTATFFHANFADQMQMINFVKNLMIMGGLLQIVHFGPGAVSVDGRK